MVDDRMSAIGESRSVKSLPSVTPPEKELLSLITRVNPFPAASRFARNMTRHVLNFPNEINSLGGFAGGSYPSDGSLACDPQSLALSSPSGWLTKINTARIVM
jgi:hypothetical protein